MPRPAGRMKLSLRPMEKMAGDLASEQRRVRKTNARAHTKADGG